MAKGNAPRCNLIFGPNVVLPPSGVNINYAMTDAFDADAGHSLSPVTILDTNLISVMAGGQVAYRYYPLYTFSPYTNRLTAPAEIMPPKTYSENVTGWFHLKVWLTPPTVTSPTLENADDLTFGAYDYQTNQVTQYPYLFNPMPTMVANPASGDPGIASLLGMRSVRMAYNESLFLPTELNPPYTSSGDTDYYGQYNYLHKFSNPSGDGPPDPNALVLFASTDVINLTGLDYYNHVYRYARPYAVPLPPQANYNPRMLSAPIAYWSLTNEPEGITSYWDRTASGQNSIKKYVDNVLMPGRQAVMDAYAGTNITPAVIAPNLNRASQRDSTNDYFLGFNDAFSWTADFLQADGAKYIDYFGVHTYTGSERSWEEQDVFGHLMKLNTLLSSDANRRQQRGDLNVKVPPLWITENGWVSSSNVNMPRQQAAFTVRNYALAAAAGIPREHNSYFYTTDHGDRDFYLYDGAPRRGGMALRILAEQMASSQQSGGKKYVNGSSDLLANYPNAKYVHALDFVDAPLQPDTIVVWGDDFLDKAFHDPNFPQDGLPPTAPASQPLVILTFTFNQQVTVFDIMGNDITPFPVTNQGQTTYAYTVPVTSSPIYIRAGHGGLLSVSGWPLLNGETNYAAASSIGSASSSSAAAPNLNTPYNNIYNGDSSLLNDGNWHYDDSDKTKQIWISRDIPTAANPVHATVQFSRAVNLDTVVAVVPAANGPYPGVRDYDLQVYRTGTPAGTPSGWFTVKSVRGNTSEWVLAANFPTMNCTGVQLVVYDMNNGNWLDDKSLLYGGPLGAFSAPLSAPFGGLRAMAYELEAYGPPSQ